MRGHNERAYRLDTLAAEARKGLERVEQGEENTIGGWLAYGHALNEGRALFPGDREFGEWIDANALRQVVGADGTARDVFDAEREAAMWAAGNADQFGEARQRGNPRTIRGIHAKWKEIEAEREAEARAEAEERARKEAAEGQEAAREPLDNSGADNAGISVAHDAAGGPATSPEPDRSQIGAGSEPAEPPAPDPHRKGLAALTREALEDECAGLRADLDDMRAERDALKAERDELKVRIRDLSEGNHGRAISRLHAQIVTLKGAQKDAMAKAAKETRRANFIAKERDELRESIQRQEVRL